MEIVSKVLVILLNKSLDAAIRSNSKQAVKTAYFEYKNSGLIETGVEKQYALAQCAEALAEIEARRRAALSY